MKRLIYKSVLLLMIIGLSDFLIGKALEYMFFANKSGAPGYVLNHIMDKKYDAYVMGASGAERGYVPSVFQKELGLRVFNTGEASTNIFHNYAALQLILRHSKPRLIIWDITNADYYYRIDAGNTGMIMPYHHDKNIRQMLVDSSPLNRVWLLSGIYPYSQQVLSIVGTYIFKPKSGVEGANGYHALYTVINPGKINDPIKQFDDEAKSVNKRTPELAGKDALLRRYFYAFIRQCQENNIRLVAFYCPKAPLTPELASDFLLSDKLRSELKLNNVPLYIITPQAYPEMRALKLYYDFSHLNDEGAKVYSGIVARHLKVELSASR